VITYKFVSHGSSTPHFSSRQNHRVKRRVFTFPPHSAARLCPAHQGPPFRLTAPHRASSEEGRCCEEPHFHRSILKTRRVVDSGFAPLRRTRCAQTRFHRPGYQLPPLRDVLTQGNVTDIVFIDPDTNYRRYSVEQVSAAHQIRAMRQPDVPLLTIRKIIGDPVLARDNLQRHRQLVYQKLEVLESKLSMLERLIRS
jgi:hypothetical protein